jgi:predicted methyltransferase
VTNELTNKLFAALAALVVGLPLALAQAADIDWPAVLSAADRSAEERARDGHRHPAETLAFFGVEPDDVVVELTPGGGWYTAILAPLLREEGRLVVATPGADNPNQYLAGTHAKLLERFAGKPAVYDRVEVRTLAPPAKVNLGPPASADAVLTFRSVHNWITRGGIEAVFAGAFAVLKPGGVFGVVEHRAVKPDWVPADAASGYVTEAFVIELAEQAGFLLDDRSEVNANPLDDHDHREGVWTLPPSLRLGEQDRAKYQAVGESDRMTLRFRKP